jgi:hypothetical protein
MYIYPHTNGIEWNSPEIKSHVQAINFQQGCQDHSVRKE